MKISKLFSALLAIAAVTLSASAVTIHFSDDFESGLGQWNVNQAVLVDSPGHGKVLTFTGTNSGGDSYTSPFVIPNAPNLYLGFEYKGGGGYVGFGMGSNNWLAGEAGYNSAIDFTPLNYDGQWHRYLLAIPSSMAGKSLMLEDFVSASTHGSFFDVFFVLEFPDGTTPTWPTPDASSSLVLLAASLAGMLCLRRRQH